MKKKYDVVICGGSLAGSAAGVALARRGYSVAMLDRAEFPRKKLCGGLLTWKSSKLLETLFGESTDSLTEAGIINFASDRYAIRSYTATLAEGTLPKPFHFVDRELLDARLLSHAETLGAAIFQNTEVISCDTKNGVVTTKEDNTFEGAYILGADGANSIVRRSFPAINKARFREQMAPTIEITLDSNDFPRPVLYPELYVGPLETGYGWVFPNKNRVIVGICGLRHDNTNFSDIFRDYLEFLNIKKTAIPPRHGHPLPYGNYLASPFHDRAMLAGDAGGFVEPLFGEGIFFAMCTGLYAGEALAEGLEKCSSPGPIYARRLHQQIMPELKGSDRLRWALFSAMKYTGPSSLKLLSIRQPRGSPKWSTASDPTPGFVKNIGISSN